MLEPGTQIGKYIILRFETMKTDERIKAYLCYDVVFNEECYITSNTIKWIARCQPVQAKRKEQEHEDAMGKSTAAHPK